MSKTLDELRTQVDEIDSRIVELLGRRFAVCREIAGFKQQVGMATMQPGRVDAVKRRVETLARQNSVDPEFAVALYGAIINEACRIEDEER